MLDWITLNAHSSIRMDTGKIVYFDPFRLDTEPHDADIVCFTHSHFDHFSTVDYPKVAKADTCFVAPKSMEKELREAGISDFVLLAPGESAQVLGLTLEAVPSYNVGKPMHPKENGWLGYVITANGLRAYVCGDMDDNEDARAVRCDIVLVPIGGTYTSDAAEGAELVNAIRPQYAIPTHFDSLPDAPALAARFHALVSPDITVCDKL